MLSRRALLACAAAAPIAALPACSADPPPYVGGWIGAQHERGHRLRETKSGSLPPPSVRRSASVLIVGAGVAGLACARALERAGLDDVHVLDLEDVPGGNSRGHQMAGMRCPLGAHYLPLPGDDAVEVIELLESLRLRRIEHGKPVYDERHLCHSPQERLFIDGQWHEGLLPPTEALPTTQQAGTLAQYRRFAQVVAQLGQGHAFAIPTARATRRAELAALDGIAFAPWLDAQGFDAPALRWMLDYCCRDDYGAGAAQVSAWAGVHYFASRHGFHAPGSGDEEHEPVLTWPEGNGWLTARLAAPLQDRLHSAQVALRVVEDRHDVAVDAWNAAAQRIERWTASHVVLATPLFVAARLLAQPPAALRDAVERMRYAPWLVANLHLADALADYPGAPPSWDNVIYGSRSLGYVDAMHQSLRPHPGATVVTAYWALGGDTVDQLQAQRQRLLDEPWTAWAARVMQDLAPAHADLVDQVKQIDLMRYGHAMAIPVPGLQSSAALRALADHRGRIGFAHSDLSGYSIFEEALYHGARAARAAKRAAAA